MNLYVDISHLSSLHTFYLFHTSNSMEIITRKRTVWLTFLDVLYKKELPLQSIHAKGVPFLCDPGAIQTHDLQNRNLTLYSLSYGAKCGCKSIKKLANS